MPKVILENEKGAQLEITNEVKFSVAITGLNPPAASLFYNENTGDGSQFQHSRVPKRNLVISGVINGDVEKNKLELYEVVQTGKYIKAYVETYSKKVWIEGEVETCEVDDYEFPVSLQISIICGEPWWKDLEQTIHLMNTTKKQFYFPYYTVNAKPVGTRESIQILNLINKGNASSGMIIELLAKGQVVNPIIYNRKTKAFIGLGTEDKPYVMQYGDKINITTDTNNKKIKLIREAEEANVFNDLTPNSEFLQVEVGDNVFTYTAEEGINNLHITFKYYSQYRGI